MLTAAISALQSLFCTTLRSRHVRLLSNNPQKVQALTNGGIEVIERIACEAPPNPYALPYLRTKKEKMGHSLTVM